MFIIHLPSEWVSRLLSDRVKCREKPSRIENEKKKTKIIASVSFLSPALYMGALYMGTSIDFLEL